jgi:hypothetical protein
MESGDEYEREDRVRPVVCVTQGRVRTCSVCAVAVEFSTTLLGCSFRPLLLRYTILGVMYNGRECKHFFSPPRYLEKMLDI